MYIVTYIRYRASSYPQIIYPHMRYCKIPLMCYYTGMTEKKDWVVVPVRFTPQQYKKLQKHKEKGRNIAHIIRELVDKHIK